MYAAEKMLTSDRNTRSDPPLLGGARLENQVPARSGAWAGLAGHLATTGNRGI
jgi:hypothetical protein